MSYILYSKFYILIFILIIAAFFRFYNITETPPGLYPDEAMNGNNALEAFKIFYPENNGREGLFINIQALSVYVLGNEPWALRGVSAIFGILTVLGVYFLTKELFSYEITKTYESTKYHIALLSAFFLAISFWHINFSRIGFRAIMAPFFLTWALYFLLLSFNKILFLKNFSAEKIKNTIQNSKFLLFSVIGGIFYGLGFHSYIAYRATPLLILIILLFYWLQNKDWQIRKKIFLSTFCFLISAFIIFAPLGLYFLNNPQDFFGRTTQISVFNSPAPIKNLSINILKTAGMINFSGDYNWRHNYAGKPQLFWPVGILFIIGVVFGIFVLLKKKDDLPALQNPVQFKKFSFLTLFLWIIIASLPIIISNEGLPHSLRAILIIPPVFILAGVGGVWFYEIMLTKIRNYTKVRKIFYFLLSAFCFLLLIEAYNTYFIKWGKNEHTAGAFSQNYVDIGRELNALPKDLPKYVIVETDGVLVRGIPMPTQTVMFITDTFTPEKQKEKNIYYVLSEQKNQIPENGYKIILR